MGGYFGIFSDRDCLEEVFFGTDYHSHLGQARAGIAAYHKDVGLQRVIHNIKNSPFRTKFEHVFEEMKATSAIGCISDSEPQPLLLRSKLGTFAISAVGRVNNADVLMEKYLNGGGQFNAMTGGNVNMVELVAALISMKGSFAEGIKFVQDVLDGSASILIMKEDGSLIAARDKFGRTPVVVGKNKHGYAVTFESFANEKLGFTNCRELGPGEAVEISENGIKELVPAGKEMRICAFLWSYYGYSTSEYEGVNVEMMRYRNGSIMAENDKELNNTEGVDYVCGVPDSGTPHAIGYSNKSNIPFARPFIKYTPTWTRSFTRAQASERVKTAKMKQLPVKTLIENKNLLFVDDSIVRGTQLKETVEFLTDNGAKSVHMRSACPPIMYPCKYVNFSRSIDDMDLIARRTIYELEGDEGANHIEEYCDASTERGKKMRKLICEKLGLASLEFQTIDGIIRAIGIPKCKLCTYCWDGRE